MRIRVIAGFLLISPCFAQTTGPAISAYYVAPGVVYNPLDPSTWTYEWAHPDSSITFYRDAVTKHLFWGVLPPAPVVLPLNLGRIDYGAMANRPTACGAGHLTFYVATDVTVVNGVPIPALLSFCAVPGDPGVWWDYNPLVVTTPTIAITQAPVQDPPSSNYFVMIGIRGPLAARPLPCDNHWIYFTTQPDPPAMFHCVGDPGVWQ